MNITLNCTVRNEFGSNKCNRIRNNGYVPGVIYGRNFTNYPLSLDKREVSRIINEYGENAIINVMINGATYQAMVKEVQKDTVSGELIHIDLQKISDTEKIHTSIPIVIHGKEALGKDTIVQQQLKKIDIECYPSNIPKSLSVDVSDIPLGSSFKVADVEFGEDITILNDNEEIILSLSRFKEEELEEDTGEESLLTEWIVNEYEKKDRDDTEKSKKIEE